MEDWLESTLGKLSRKSAVASAISYALGRWPALIRYCNDGLLEIDNNAANAAGGICGVGLDRFVVFSCDACLPD